MALASLRLMRRFDISWDFLELLFLLRILSIARKKASGTANKPIARVTKLIPLCKSIMPRVNRGAWKSDDSPTVANINPRSVIMTAFSTLPLPAKAETADKPRSIRAKYSADQNKIAKPASAGAKNINNTTPMVPPEKEEIAAIVKALPACPFRAMG